MSEFNAVEHELVVAKYQLRLARYALFDEVIDYALDGMCTREEAIAQFVHDDGELELPSDPLH